MYQVTIPLYQQMAKRAILQAFAENLKTLNALFQTHGSALVRNSLLRNLWFLYG